MATSRVLRFAPCFPPQFLTAMASQSGMAAVAAQMEQIRLQSAQQCSQQRNRAAKATLDHAKHMGPGAGQGNSA